VIEQPGAVSEVKSGEGVSPSLEGVVWGLGKRQYIPPQKIFEFCP